MLKRVLVKAIVPDPENAEEYTVYLLSKRKKKLLPINITTDSAKALTVAEQKLPEMRPHIHDTTRRIISSIGARVTAAIIYLSKDNIFYSYVRIRSGNQEVDIDARVTDAVALAIRFKCKVFVEERILNHHGIQLSKDLLTIS